MAAEQPVEWQLRDLIPRVLGAVVRRCGDFSAAEDAVQDALLAAASEWPSRGAPANPGGWLFHVACQRYRDHLDAEAARRRREAEVGALAGPGVVGPAAEFAADLAEWGDPDDDTLRLLFHCCHPSLTPPTAVALTLRAVAGLATAAIASAFLTSEAVMAQRIARAKQTIRDSAVPFALPTAAERPARLAAVLHVLYVMGNEGHVASAGERLDRPDLAREAIRLARLLLRLVPDHAEAAGLLALLLLTEARRAARTGPSGELIPLDEQDRSQWDRAATAEGTALVTDAFHRGQVGSYQLQAAIASLHAEAPSIQATDWPQILVLYGLLLRIADNPMVALNRTVALAMVHGPAAGLAALRELAGDRRIAGHYRLAAVRAHLLELSGDFVGASEAFRAAADGATNGAERAHLLGKAARLGGGGRRVEP